jgi:hypothetical protein
MAVQKSFGAIDVPLTSVAASYTMLVRTRFMGLLFVLLAACGSDPASDANGQSGACTPGTTSVMGSPTDPCHNTAVEQSCGFQAGMTVATCSAAGTWVTCSCTPMPGSTTTATPAAGKCGDGVVQAELGEQCEQGISSTTCAALTVKGATGLVNCVSCKYDMSLCVPPTSTGTGGTGVTGGTGSTSTAGTGR